MKTKRILPYLGGAMIIVLGLTGIAAAKITYNEELEVNNTGRFDSVYVGKQDVGGVTFFNGTIVNSTTTSGANNPVTFGDNVRIDGTLFRTEAGGSNPLKVDDTVIPQSDNTHSLGSATNQFKDGYFSGTLNAPGVVASLGESSGISSTTTTASGSNYDTLTEKEVTVSGNSTLFCNFTGYFSNDTDGMTARIYLLVDDQLVNQSVRVGTSAQAGHSFTLATSNLVNVEAGTHTVKIGWNTSDSTISTANNYALDVLEIKQ
ncbi:hypothetical protein KKC60_01595 [Patescibacteria group bacterium]|nr:hypothetical protein [Patescibacteria group bacterium]